MEFLQHLAHVRIGVAGAPCPFPSDPPSACEKAFCSSRHVAPVAMARQALLRLGRGGALVLGVGLAAKELHDSVFEAAQVDRRAELLLGLAPEALKERRQREQRLRGLMAQAEGRKRELLRASEGEAQQAQLAKLRQQLVEEAHRVMYPEISPAELQERRRKFGNVKWTEEAMERLRGLSPLVEAMHHMPLLPQK